MRAVSRPGERTVKVVRVFEVDAGVHDRGPQGGETLTRIAGRLRDFRQWFAVGLRDVLSGFRKPFPLRGGS
jgi:hypothetical protein